MEIRALLFLAAAASASVLADCAPVALAPAPVTIATGTPGSIYHPVGNAICRLFNLTEAAEAGSCIAVSSEGSLANLQLVRSGEAMLGLAQSDVAYAAFRGEGPFSSAGPDEALRILIALHSESFSASLRAMRCSMGGLHRIGIPSGPPRRSLSAGTALTSSRIPC